MIKGKQVGKSFLIDISYQRSGIGEPYLRRKVVVLGDTYLQQNRRPLLAGSFETMIAFFI